MTETTRHNKADIEIDEEDDLDEDAMVPTRPEIHTSRALHCPNWSQLLSMLVFILVFIVVIPRLLSYNLWTLDKDYTMDDAIKRSAILKESIEDKKESQSQKIIYNAGQKAWLLAAL